MPSQIKVDQIAGASGNTVTVPSGQTLDISSATLSLPSTIVTTTGTQTLTNKTIGVSQLTGTLPVANGGTGLTSLGTASQVLRVNSGATALEFGSVGGGILQLKSANEPAKLTTTSTTYTGITNLSVTLTPASSSNKVLILANVNASGRNGANAGGGFAIYKNGSILADVNGNASGSRTRGFAQSISGYAPSSSQEWVIQQGSVIFLDSPATTSSTTYQVYWRCEDTTGGSVLNAGYDDGDGSDRRRHSSNITIMEIASTIL